MFEIPSRFGKGSSRLPTDPVINPADFAATRDVSFSIPRGQVCAFLGPNGAGKSTTMKLLTGYLAPSAGQARIAGFDVRTQRIQAAGSQSIQ